MIEPPIQMSQWSFSTDIYWPEREADITPQSTAFHSPTCLYAVVVNKADGKKNLSPISV